MIRARDPFGDPEQLIDRVYADVALRTSPGADADDGTSETFERALRHRASGHSLEATIRDHLRPEEK